MNHTTHIYHILHTITLPPQQTQLINGAKIATLLNKTKKTMETKRIILAMNAKIKDQEKCKKAMEEIVKEAYSEAATKSHWWCTTQDKESLFVLEQYDNAEAAIKHIKANPPARADFFESIEVVNVIIYCNLTPELKEMFKPLNPIYMNYYGGFSK